MTDYLFSLGAVLPFLGILIAPEHVFNIPIVMDVAHYFGITSAEQLVLPLTLVSAVAALMTGVSLMLKMIFKGNALSPRSQLSLLFWFALAPRPYGRILNPTTRPYYWARYCTC
jgi:ATP-binding cassette, subfamily B, bacterial PglK